MSETTIRPKGWNDIITVDVGIGGTTSISLIIAKGMPGERSGLLLLSDCERKALRKALKRA